jgi:hypothetical protein
VYKEELFEPLIRTIEKKSHAGTTVLLAMTRAFVSPKFFALLEQHNFDYCKVSTDKIKAGKLANARKHDESLIGIFALYKTPFTESWLN